jgi:hypothetical protein
MKISQLNHLSSSFLFLSKNEDSYLVEWKPTTKADAAPITASRFNRPYLFRVVVYKNTIEIGSWWADVAANKTNAAHFVIKAESHKAISNEG